MSGSRITFKSSQDQAKSGLLLEKIWKTLSLKNENITYIDIFTFEGVIPVLAGYLKFPIDWTDEEIGSRLRRAALSTKKSGIETCERFLEELTTASNGLLTETFTKYSMWTKVSICGPIVRPLQFSANGCVVRLRTHPPARLQFKKGFISGIGDIDPSYPNGGIVAISSGQFKSKSQAGQGLHLAISDVASAINFAHRKWRSEWHSGKARPKAKVLLGSNQFLFQENLSLNSDMIWYNPDFTEESWDRVALQMNEFSNLLPYVRHILRRFKDSNSGATIVSAVRMMTDGMTSHNTNHRILRTWSALEILLSRNASQADRSEDIIRRATVLLKEKELWRLRLKQAMNARHDFVHKNKEGVMAAATSNTLDTLFCTLIDWLLARPRMFENHEQVLDFFDLRHDGACLNKQINLRKLALKVMDI